SSDLAVDQVVHVRNLGCDRDPAGPSRGARAQERDNMVAADRFETVNVEPEVGTHVLEVSEEAPDSLTASVHTGDSRRMQLDILAAVGQISIEVPCVDGRDRAPNGLHV